MSKQELHLPQVPAKAGTMLAPAWLDTSAQEAARRQHHRERLTRLFRRIGDSADDRYLLELMRRYRGVELP
jgi:hypothetical protein